MESDISQAFQEELTCFICRKGLIDPVTICCGHSFCRPCLCLSWEDIQPPAHCPVCREPSQQKELRTNLLLKKLVSIARQASLRKCLNCEENMCVTHKETKRIFCQEDRILLCQLCSNSQEHEGHRHCPVEAAVEEQREKLFKKMAYLWEKILENQNNINEVNRIIIPWMGYAATWAEMLRREYRRTHGTHYEEEKRHVAFLQDECRDISDSLQRSKAMMVQKGSQLRQVYQDMVAMCHGPYGCLLQNFGAMVTRCESVQLRMPQLVKPALSAKPIPGLIHRASQFQEGITFQNIIMIHYKMSLFTDVRRFNFRQQPENTSVNLDGTYYFACWGDQSFSYGKRYWELGVNDSWDWAVGICKDSWLRKCGPLIELEDMFLLVFVKEGDHSSLLTTCPSFIHYVEIPLGQVGVLLDCDDGSVSFLNVAKNSLIWRYPAGSFQFPCQAFLFLWPHWTRRDCKTKRLSNP